ncbi:hypothetical protein GW17_00047993 [Ensete ventricosum]|nr:hypothetical protein GW17_00047993 [Ensete ventricosum]
MIDRQAHAVNTCPPNEESFGGKQPTLERGTLEAPQAITRHLESDILSSDSTDSLWTQLHLVNHRLDEVQKELHKFLVANRRAPIIIPEMLQRTSQYITAEALVAGKRDEHKRPHPEKPRGQPLEPPRRRFNWSEPSYPRSSQPLLNSTRKEIFLQIKEKGLLRMPNLMKTSREFQY